MELKFINRKPMKKLNGKCLLAFFEWQQNKGYENFNPKKYSLDVAKAMNNSILIEFFDSVGIYINALSFEKGGYWKAICSNDMLKKKYASRTEATNEAIIKANILFNQK